MPRKPDWNLLLYHWGPVIAWMVIIFMISSAPQSAIEESGLVTSVSRVISKPVGEIAVHVFEFGVLALLVYRLAGRRERTTTAQAWVVAVGFSVLYGVSDEVHQGFVPGRDTSWVDLGYDTAGAVVSATIALLAARLLSMRAEGRAP